MEQENRLETVVVEEMALVVRLDGAIVESNFDEWRERAVAIVEGFNLQPATAEECGNAKQDVATCTKMEKAIDVAIEKILEQNQEINRIINGATTIKKRFASSRTTMSKATEAFASQAKEKVFNEYVTQVNAAVVGSPVAGEFKVDMAAMKAAMKGKSSEDSIRACLRDEVERQVTTLKSMEQLYAINAVIIDQKEQEWPGIAYDKGQLALKPTEVVEALLTARIATMEAARIKKEAEEAVAKARQEAEAAATKAREETEKAAAKAKNEVEEAAPKSEPAQEPISTDGTIVMGRPSFLGVDMGESDDRTVTVPSFAKFEEEPESGCSIIIKLDCNQDAAAPLLQHLRKFKHVVSVEFAEAEEIFW